MDVIWRDSQVHCFVTLDNDVINLWIIFFPDFFPDFPDFPDFLIFLKSNLNFSDIFPYLSKHITIKENQYYRNAERDTFLFLEIL